MTMDQLITRLPTQDQATVYRNIKIFEDLGIVSRVHIAGQSKVELSDIFQHHHHHLTCTSCGRVTILKENSLVESEIEKITLALRFKPLDHQLEIRGLCSTCQDVIP